MTSCSGKTPPSGGRPIPALRKSNQLQEDCLHQHCELNGTRST